MQYDLGFNNIHKSISKKRGEEYHILHHKKFQDSNHADQILIL